MNLNTNNKNQSTLSVHLYEKIGNNLKNANMNQNHNKRDKINCGGMKNGYADNYTNQVHSLKRTKDQMQLSTHVTTANSIHEYMPTYPLLKEHQLSYMQAPCCVFSSSLVSNFICKISKIFAKIPFIKLKEGIKITILQATPIELHPFLHHCATLIQARYRGYIQSKRYLAFRPIMRRVKELLAALIQGWKVRRIIKMRYIASKIEKIKKLGTHQPALDGGASIVNRNQRQARILKRQLLEQIDHISKKGRWLQFYKKQLKIHQKQILKSKVTKIILKTKQTSNPQKIQEHNKSLKNVKSVSKNLHNNCKNSQQPQQEQYNNLPAQGQMQQDKCKTKKKQDGFASQVEIPIVAKGFYNFDGQVISDHELKNKDSIKQKPTKKQPKNPSKKQKNSILSKNSQIISTDELKIPEKSTNITPSLGTNHNKSVSLPIEQIDCSQYIGNRQVENKAMNNDIKKMLSIGRGKGGETKEFANDSNPPLKCLSINLANDDWDKNIKKSHLVINSLQNSKKQMNQTQKRKRSQRKGIKLTICASNPGQNLVQSKIYIAPKQMSNTTNLITPASNTYKKIQSKQIEQKQSKKIVQQKKIQENVKNDHLSQIIEVYNGTYSRKKQQITAKMAEMKNNMKYLSK